MFLCVNCLKPYVLHLLPYFRCPVDFHWFFVVVQSNPVPGLCPCCKNPQFSDFLQSIHAEILFTKVQELATHFGHGKLGRKYLFCVQCIGWAKGEVTKRYEQLQTAGPSQQPDQSQQLGALQPSGQLQPEVAFCQPHYSPVSDPEHSTPEPFNMQLYSQESRIGARLANTNDSPIHLGADEHMLFSSLSICSIFV